MNRELIVVENFYDDPHSVRKLALSKPFSRQGGNGHFERTASYFPFNIVETLETLIDGRILLDKDWTHPRTEDGRNLDTFNGTFFRVAKGTHPPTHVHHDGHDWIGIVYMSPACPSTEGTNFYEHIETKAICTEYPVARSGDAITRRDGSNLSKWKCTESIGFRFNRLLLYHGIRYHSACITYPGERMCQLFAFNTRK